MIHNESTVKNVLTVVLIAIIVMLVAFGLSLWLTPKSKASSKLIVIFNEQGIDAYAASKNSSYITGILSEIVYSNSFINNVYENHLGLKDDLGFGQDNRLKEWKKHVKVKTQDNKGIIIIDTFYDNKDQAYQLNQGVGSVLTSKHGQYDGFGDKVTLKTIDGPSVAENWYQFQIIQNSILGLVLGLFLGFSFIVVFPQQQIFRIFTTEYDSLIRNDETIGLNNSYQMSKDFTPYNSQWMDYSISQNEAPNGPNLEK